MRRVRVAIYLSVCLLAGAASGAAAEDGPLAPADQTVTTVADTSAPVADTSAPVGGTASAPPDPAVQEDVTSDPIGRAAQDGAPPALIPAVVVTTPRKRADAVSTPPRQHRIEKRPKKQKTLARTYRLVRLLPQPNGPVNTVSPAFARELMTVSRGAGLDWAVLLAVSRTGDVRRLPPMAVAPFAATQLRTLAWRLADLHAARNPWGATTALAGWGVVAERARALWRYYRAISMKTLVRGLHRSGPTLARLILNDPRITLTPAARYDVTSGEIDPRVLATVRYLAETFGQVTVSCLKTGHREFARPGVVSAHFYGRAVDVSSLGGIPIAGHQGPDTITEWGVRALLMLPPEVRPRQVISLVDLGGVSFALGDHADHIHIGYR